MTSRLSQIESMLREQPNDPFLLFALAKEHEKNEEAKKAIIVFEKLRQLHPDYVGLYYHLAALYAETEQSNLAKTIYIQGIEVARKQNEHHALSELQNAYTNFQLDV